MTKLDYVFEDTDILVINKPPGWIVTEASTTGSTPVLQTLLKNEYDFETAKNREFRSGIVHRLDKETSGALIIAKNKKAFKNIQIQFKKRIVKKKYLALLHGKIEVEEGMINVPVGRLPWNRERFGVLPGGREAVSYYRLKDIYKKQSNYFSLVEFKPVTGRTHQIRIHSKYINHPLVSDNFYAGRKTSRNDRKWCPRLFLHAWKIQFEHPVSGNLIEIEVPLFKDLSDCLGELELIQKSNPAKHKNKL